MFDIVMAILIIIGCFVIGTVALVVSFCLVVALSRKENIEDDWIIVGYNDDKE